MDKKHYTCNYCFEEYVPKRRRVQKYCSNTCRSKAYHYRTQSNQVSESKSKKPNSKMKVEKMSLAGIGNSAVAVVGVNLLTKAFTKEENMPSTKADLKRLEDKLKRYHRVNNLEQRMDGTIPYFDLETKTIIYLKHIPRI